jgi:hypothetical protein
MSRMRSFRREALVIVALSASGNAACGDDECEGAACIAAEPAESEDGSYPPVAPPAGCDAQMDPRDAAACVDDSFALFVDPRSGNDENMGTRAAPLRTILAAGKPAKRKGRERIYVCNGADVDETVRLYPNTSLAGGFACGTWRWDGAPTRIAPGRSFGAVIEISGSPKRVFVSDALVKAPDGREDGESAVALFVNASRVTLRRVVAHAGRGANGGITSATSNWSAEPLDGNSATGQTGANEKLCGCPQGGSSKGGRGGDLGEAGRPGGLDPTFDFPVDDLVGLGGAAGCQPGGAGSGLRLNTVSGGRASNLGVLTAGGWLPARGGAGIPGTGGAGGGGGGGSTLSGGGSGGCGGCGGAGGGGGDGGGASVALAILESDVVLEAGTYSAGIAGNGARGGDGELGQSGGRGGAGGPSFTSCSGGAGGDGAGGSGGAGGAGGISAPVLHSKSRLQFDTTVLFILGAPGEAGEGGRGAVAGGDVSNPGEPGRRQTAMSNLLEL